MQEITDELLIRFGYAPGNYILLKCHDCGKQIHNVDKRALTCRECAIKRCEKWIGQEKLEQMQKELAFSKLKSDITKIIKTECRCCDEGKNFVSDWQVVDIEDATDEIIKLLKQTNLELLK